MKKYRKYINEFNKNPEERNVKTANSKDIKNDLDISRVFPEESKKISIALEYDPLLKSNILEGDDIFFYGIDENGNVIKRYDLDNYYYGVSPKISNKLIKESIYRISFEEDGLCKFIKENHKYFMFDRKIECIRNKETNLNITPKDCVLSISKYIILSIASNFGVGFDFKDDTILNKLIENIDYVKFKEKGETNYYLIGCLQKKVKDLLKSYKFEKTDKGFFTEAEVGVDIENIYKDVDNIVTPNSKFLYSGAFLRPLKIELADKLNTNKDVTSYIIRFERSSFGTVYAFDYLYALDHDILTLDERNTINDFFEYDDNKVSDLVSKLSEGDNYFLTALNNYLYSSINVHQLLVSGNIIAKDDILIFAERAKNLIDSASENNNQKREKVIKSLYPSSNGNAEVLSVDVDYYKYSVHEDLPTIDLSNVRLDCNKEFSREAYAELKVIIPSSGWDYYGMCLCGASKSYALGSDNKRVCRRMQINLMASQRIDKDFNTVYYLQKNATESFESNKIVGLKLNTYKNWFICIMKKLYNILKRISSSWILVDIALLIVSGVTFSWENIISIIFVIISGILFVVTLVSEIRHWCFSKKNVKKVSIFPCEKSFKCGYICNCKNSKKTYKVFKEYSMHPATRRLLDLYLRDKLNEFRKNDCEKNSNDK